ncbi:MAG: type 4a pilus biogenesis protein PilO [bacterium]
MDLSDQRTQIILLAVLGVLGGLYGWFTYIYSPRGEEIAQLEQQTGSLQGEIRTLQTKVDQLPEVESQLADAQALWQQTLISFPAEPREEEVLSAMSVSEQSSGVFIRSVNKGESRTRSLYIEQDYQLDMVGEYHELGRFIEDLASQPRRMSVQRIQLLHPSAAEGGGAGPSPQEGEVIIRCTVTTYVVREN